MTKTTRTSSTGGTITEIFDLDGRRVRVLHTAGKTYGGDAQVEDTDAEDEGKPRRQTKKKA